jgi:hypothetical protein
MPIEILDGASGQERRNTTVGEILSKLRDDELIEVETAFGTVRVRTRFNETRYSGLSFNVNLLGIWLELQNKGVNAFHASFYWYESDFVKDDPQESHTFFVVADKKIVEESVSFGDHSHSGFDPSVFQLRNRADTVWFHDRDWQEAWDRFWYRKFYSETQIGQLMALRPDEPELYFYPEGRFYSAVSANVLHLHTQFTKIRSTLLMLVSVGVLIAVIVLVRR